MGIEERRQRQKKGPPDISLIWHAKTECRDQKTEGRKRRGRSGSETSTPTRSSDADGRRLPVEPPMAGSGTATASYSLLGPVV
uniref:Uncharacterized protein n=1 Tax=Oryza nivara TaxID=4536 RepID=A0A0E0GZ49_ORYNI